MEPLPRVNSDEYDCSRRRRFAAGIDPGEAYQFAFGANLFAQSLAFVWFLVTPIKSRPQARRKPIRILYFLTAHTDPAPFRPYPAAPIAGALLFRKLALQSSAGADEASGSFGNHRFRAVGISAEAFAKLPMLNFGNRAEPWVTFAHGPASSHPLPRHPPLPEPQRGHDG